MGKLIEVRDPNAIDPKEILLHDPRYVQLTCNYNRYSFYIDLIRYCLYIAVFVFILFKFIVNIGPDVKDENKRFYFFRLQRRNDCYLDYIANNCNQTTSPAQTQRCAQLFKCYTEIDQRKNYIGAIKYTWELINDFFYFLGKKSSVFLGFLCGCILFCTIKL